MAERGKVVVALILGAAIFYPKVSGAESGRLRFRPELGKKQTVQITSHMASIPKVSGKSDATERHWVLTLELEPTDIAADGSVTIRVTILRIQYKLSTARGMKEFPVTDLDSADETWRSADQTLGNEQEKCLCLAPIGESFTAVVSDRGRVIKIDSEAFCAAVARKRIQYEDETIRRTTIRVMAYRYKDETEETKRRLLEADVAKAIRDENTRYGSPARREQDHRKAASECYLYSTGQLRLLLNDVLVPFPEEPVAQDGRWTAPFLMIADGPIPLTGTYALKSGGDGVRTIQVEAERTPDDQSINEPNIPDEYRTRLTGVSRTTLKIDAATGVLLSRETSADLTGRTPIVFPEPPPKVGQPPQFKVNGVLPVDIRATTTVQTLPQDIRSL